VTNRQIEAGRRSITRYVKRGGKVWIRMVKPGRILYEMRGVSEAEAREAMRLAAHKLPIATKFVTRSKEVLG